MERRTFRPDEDAETEDKHTHYEFHELLQSGEDRLTASGSIRRFGMIIGLREECADAYIALHAGSGVRDLLAAANIRNFSIFLHRLPDGRLYEFGYYEYAGKDYERDMEALAAHPRNTEWLALCDPMQLPLPGETGWAEMEQVFYNP